MWETIGAFHVVAVITIWTIQGLPRTLSCNDNEIRTTGIPCFCAFCCTQLFPTSSPQACAQHLILLPSMFCYKTTCTGRERVVRYSGPLNSHGFAYNFYPVSYDDYEPLLLVSYRSVSEPQHHATLPLPPIYLLFERRVEMTQQSGDYQQSEG